MNGIRKLWRESASLLILGKNTKFDANNYNYKILVAKRSNKSSFMASATVFPGGVFELTDESTEWLELYKNLGITQNKFDDLVKVQGPRPSIFQKPINDNCLAKEISLRICAVRETFEEAGLLICKNKQQFAENKLYSHHTEDFDISHWQKVVHSDSGQFLKLCQSLNVAPDLWSLYEWSAWLTPVLLNKRFETAFFIVALEDQPNFLAESTEVSHMAWESPLDMFFQFRNQKVLITAPQIYELARLNSVNDLEKLLKFAKERNNKGTTLLFPVLFETKDSYVTVLPGDDFYPNEPNYYGSDVDEHKYANLSLEEFEKLAKNLHRMERDITRPSLRVNIQPLNGHLKPIYPDTKQVLSKI